MKLLISLLLTGLLLFLSCGEGGTDVAGGSEVGNCMIQGNLYYSDGHSAANAFVQLYASNDTLALKTARTGTNGVFSFDTVSKGIYNISASDSTGAVVLVDSIGVPKAVKDTVVTIADTLRAPGGFSGMAVLADKSNHAGTFVYIPGSSFMTGTDLNGQFALSGVAIGQRNLILYHAGYIPVSIQATLASGATTTLATVTLYPEDSPFPKPGNLAFRYDTLLQEVHLTWSPVALSGVSWYKLQRRHIDSAFADITPLAIADTIFTDTWNYGLQQDNRYVYRVAAVDGSDKAGIFSGPETVLIAPAYKLVDSISLDIEPADATVDGEGNIYITNGIDRINKYDSSFNLIYSLPKSGSGVELANPIGMGIDKDGNIFTGDDQGIVKFSSSGEFDGRFWNTTELGVLDQNYLRDIAVADTTVYVAHKEFIAVFNSQGHFYYKQNLLETKSIEVSDTILYLTSTQNELKLLSNLSYETIVTKSPAVFELSGGCSYPLLSGFSIDNDSVWLFSSYKTAECYIITIYKISLLGEILVKTQIIQKEYVFKILKKGENIYVLQKSGNQLLILQ